MTDRDRRIQLDAKEARCRPTQHCSTRAHCARFLAVIPPANAVLADFSPDIVGALCLHYLPASKHLKPQPLRPKGPRPWVDHDG